VSCRYRSPGSAPSRVSSTDLHLNEIRFHSHRYIQIWKDNEKETEINECGGCVRKLTSKEHRNVRESD